MAFGNTVYFLVFTALVAVNFIFADETLLSDVYQDDLSESVSRQAREAEDSNDQPEPAQERLFFSLFPLMTTCNYTNTPGSYCASCFQAAQCRPNGNAIVRRCGGFLPYCYAGRCSFLADPVACNGTVTG